MLTARDVLSLQHSIGNRAVMRLINAAKQGGDSALAAPPKPARALPGIPGRVQLRPDTDPYFNKWTDTTWEAYRPPGSPVRTDLTGYQEEIADAKTARDKNQPRSLDLAKAWVSYAFTRGTGGPGDVEDVYVAKDDQDAGGYSISQKVTGLPLIVIHAHMEKNHRPAESGEGEMGPVHWKWMDQQLVAGAGGKIDPTLYPQLLNLTAARQKRNEQIVGAYKTDNATSTLPTLLAKLFPSAIADLVLGALASRFPNNIKDIQAFLTTLADSKLPEVVSALSIKTSGASGPESDTPRDIMIRTQLLIYLCSGRDATQVIQKRAELTGLDQTRVEELQPVKLDTGVMEIRPMLGSIGIPPTNRLNQVKLGQIRAIFDRIMGTDVKYNSAAVPLQLISDVRKARATTPTAKMGDVFNTFSPKSEDTITTYDAADCVAMADKVKQELAAIGITAQVIGSNGGNFLNEIPDPANVGRGRIMHDEAHKHALYSHASVLVPYIDDAGTPKAIHMESGMGPDPKFYKTYDSLFAADLGLSKSKYLLDQPVVDPVDLQKRHVRCKWKMYLSDTPDQKRKTFIDLAEGVIFVSQWKDPDLVKSLPGAKINFREVLAAPDKEVTITIKDTDVRMTNAESLMLFLKAIQKDFGLPASFVDNMLYLASHVKEYSEEILLGPIDAVRETFEIKTQVMAAKEKAAEIDTAKADPYQKALASAGLDITAATEFVQQGNAKAAHAKYASALAKFQTMINTVHAQNTADLGVSALRIRVNTLFGQVNAMTIPDEKKPDFESAKLRIAEAEAYMADSYAKKAQFAFTAAERILNNILVWKPKPTTTDDEDYGFDLFG